MEFLFIFLTGLTTGGLSCLAVHGGLLASVIATSKEEERAQILKNTKQKSQPQIQQQLLKHNFSLKSFDQLDWLPVAMFLGGKLISHVAFGFLLGALGSVISLGLGMRLFFQAFTAFFLFSTAMNLLNAHPFFRFVAIQPPRFVQRMVRNTSKSKALFAPFVLGLMTVLIPCGVTQAMELLAINTGSAISGALIMFAFVLGTMPLFAIIGIATAKLSEAWYQKFNKFAAYSLILMAAYSLNGILVVSNSPVTAQKMIAPVTYFFSEERFAPSATTVVADGVQKVVIQVENRGYNPKYVKVSKGVPVELTLSSQDTYSCALAFVFKEYGISTFLESTDRQVFTFTPTKSGKFTYTCSMGMYSGVMEVI